MPRRRVALLRPCTTSAGFLATPEQQRRVDMAALKTALLAGGYELVVDARVLLIVRAPAGTESSIHDNGKVLLKTTDPEAAQATYDALRPHLERAWT